MLGPRAHSKCQCSAAPEPVGWQAGRPAQQLRGLPEAAQRNGTLAQGYHTTAWSPIRRA